MKTRLTMLFVLQLLLISAVRVVPLQLTIDQVIEEAANMSLSGFMLNDDISHIFDFQPNNETGSNNNSMGLIINNNVGANNNNNGFVRIELDMVLSADRYKQMRPATSDPDKNGPGYVEPFVPQIPVVKGAVPRNFARDLLLRWPSGIIPYDFSDDANFDATDMIEFHSALSDFHNFTCLKFRKRNPKLDNSYLFIINGDGCYSHVGRVLKKQELSLAPGCRRKGIMQHELMHSIGFYHEQSRPDRDAYIDILQSNVIPWLLHNFDKNPPDQVDSFSSKYDYLSIMHYGQSAFSARGEMTIRTADPSYQNAIGQRQILSFEDIKQVNRAYRCFRGCQQKEQDCGSEGFLGKDCLCWCPPPRVPGSSLAIMPVVPAVRCDSLPDRTTTTTTIATPKPTKAWSTASRRYYKLPTTTKRTTPSTSTSTSTTTTTTPTTSTSTTSSTTTSTSTSTSTSTTTTSLPSTKTSTTTSPSTTTSTTTSTSTSTTSTTSTPPSSSTTSSVLHAKIDNSLDGGDSKPIVIIDIQQKIETAPENNAKTNETANNNNNNNNNGNINQSGSGAGHRSPLSVRPEMVISVSNNGALEVDKKPQIELGSNSNRAGSGVTKSHTCSDFVAKCLEWASNGDCFKMERFMTNYCPDACGLCGPTTTKAPTEMCSDAEPRCEVWKRFGLCRIASYNDWMAQKCAKSCGVCNENGKIALPSVVDAGAPVGGIGGMRVNLIDDRNINWAGLPNPSFYGGRDDTTTTSTTTSTSTTTTTTTETLPQKTTNNHNNAIVNRGITNVKKLRRPSLFRRVSVRPLLQFDNGNGGSFNGSVPLNDSSTLHQNGNWLLLPNVKMINQFDLLVDDGEPSGAGNGTGSRARPRNHQNNQQLKPTCADTSSSCKTLAAQGLCPPLVALSPPDNNNRNGIRHRTSVLRRFAALHCRKSCGRCV